MDLNIDKKTFIILPMIFFIFIFLIAITGLLQYSVIKKNMDELLKNEGEVIFNYLNTEISQVLEYLSIAERSPSFVPLEIINVFAYDETIIGDFYYMLKNTKTSDLMDAPVSNLLVVDTKGNIMAKKGAIKIKKSDIDTLLKQKQDTMIKAPHENKNSLLMGIKDDERIIFFTIDKNELNTLRNRYIIRDIIDRELGRFNLKGITIFDEQKRVYLDTNGEKQKVFLLSKDMDSRFLKGYSMDIYLSRESADKVLERIRISFFLILLSLVTVSIIVFFLMRRYERHIEDIKKEIALNERLISLGNLASGMAHEIRNPLNAIGLSIQRLKREFTPIEEKKVEYERFIDIMRNEIARVNRVVEEFLSSTRNETVFTRQNIYNIIDEVVTMLKEEAYLKGIEIKNTIDAQFYIDCQKDRLKQAFHNIILNSIQAIKEKGCINISSLNSDGEVDIIIKDDGVGIKKEDMGKIFDYYYTTKDKGIGIGLAISYLIIKEHFGSIKVNSKEGRGTTFIVTLPIETKRNKG